MVTPRSMDSILAELRRAAVSDAMDEELAGLGIIRSWDARDLLLADERARAAFWWPVHERAHDVVKAMDGGGRRLAVWLSSMGRDGFARDRAVTRLARDTDLNADRLIALRLNDPVELVRVRAWKALESRFSTDQARAVVPVLVRLSGRLRAAGAATRYGSMFAEQQGTPLWSVLLDHSDRDARRWGFGTALRAGRIEPDQAMDLLSSEVDQWVAARLVGSVIESGDVHLMKQLLASRHATARASALSSLPEAELGDAAIESALLDRAAKVRVAARYRASLRDIPAASHYRRAWEERHDPRALAGAAECGEKFTVEELRSYLGDTDPRVRATSVQLLTGRLEAEDIPPLFALLDDPNPGPAGRAARALVASDGLWPYGAAAALWETADPAKRSRIWRLLTGRGGWDRVRGDLLAASDPNPGVSGLGRADLEAWSQFAASRMWRRPTDDQVDDIKRLLLTTQIKHELREAIEFRAGLPITPRPRTAWDGADAVVLVALRGTGGLLRVSMDLPGLIGSIDAHNHDVLPYTRLNQSLGRLTAAGIVEATTHETFRLTAEGRQLLKSAPGSMTARSISVLALLNQRDVPRGNWTLNPDAYDRAVRAYIGRHDQDT